MNTSKHHAIEKRLGYHFKQPRLLAQALTHRSFNADHNERLEFLGDALLDTIIAAWLYEHKQQAEEGDLTRLRASIVKGTQLAVIARQLQLGDYIRLGSGELKSGGARRDSTLANALEAIIAAVYLDSDYPTCEQFTLNIFTPHLDTLPSAQALKDAKTRLQELLQGKGYATPDYLVIAETGPEHARQFHIQANTEHHSVKAVGSSRKKAEQQAAEALLTYYQQKKL